VIEMSTNQQNYPRTAYTLSLIAGILMILSSIFVSFMFPLFLIAATYHRMIFFAWPTLAFWYDALFRPSIRHNSTNLSIYA